MKKKLSLLLLAFVLVCSNFVVASAEDAPVYNKVTGTQAVEAVGSETIVTIDVRAKENYDKGHLKGSISMPLFDANGVTTGEDALAEAFTASVEAIEATLAGKDIYILCNSGARGAQNATALLIAAGYSNDVIFTIEGGAKGTDTDKMVPENLLFVSSDYALNAVKEGGSIILDVRATEVYYANGYLDKSLHQPLFNRVEEQNVVTDRKDDLAKDFNAFVAANKDTLTNNNVYILCNGGASGAAAATYLLDQAGISGNVFTIEGGANALKEAQPELFVNQKYISGADVVAITGTSTTKGTGSDSVVIINVRTVENYNKGHLKGSLSYPLFDANGVTNGYDQLAQDFLANVKANAATFDGKDIYIVCNGGARGAKAATKLLMQAGYSNSKIYTIEGGAGGTETDKSVPTNSTFVSAAQALSVIGNEDYVILDVRAAERYEDGHLKGSVSLPLFTVNEKNENVAVQAPYTDELSMAFKKYVEDNKESLAKKTIYILCNSGESGARNASTLLAEANLTTNVFTIDGGANKNESIQIAFNNTVTGAEAVAAIGSETVVIIDVRTKENYDKGHLKGSISMPLFDANGVTNGEDALAKAFTESVKANEEVLAGKDIYILCNSGARGAQAATKLLKAAGYANSDIFTITGGAKGVEADMSVPQNLTYVSADQALSVVGNADYVIIDVRAAKRYEAGHLKGSVSLPLFTVDANDKNVPVAEPYTDELSQAFLKYVEANKEALSGKTIYILCNSGATGAKNATALLAKSGITANVYTIEGGATNKSIQDAFVKEAPQTGDMAPTMGYILAMLVAAVVIMASKKKLAK